MFMGSWIFGRRLWLTLRHKVISRSHRWRRTSCLWFVSYMHACYSKKQTFVDSFNSHNTTSSLYIWTKSGLIMSIHVVHLVCSVGTLRRARVVLQLLIESVTQVTWDLVVIVVAAGGITNDDHLPVRQHSTSFHRHRITYAAAARIDWPHFLPSSSAAAVG